MRLNKKFEWGSLLKGGANLLLGAVAGPFTPLIKGGLSMANKYVNGRLRKWSWGNLLKGGLSALNGAVNGRLSKA